jgi:hypothetical protein
MIGRLWPLSIILCLCACADATFETKRNVAVAPFFFINKEPPKTAGELLLEDEQEVFRPMQDLDLATERDERHLALGLDTPEPPVPAGCSIKDRFDRKAAVAYNFDDRKSRLALHLDMGDTGFGGIEVDKVMVKYTYKFQDIPHRKDKCKYPSGFQGWAGSIYNEFFVRQNDTVWDQLREENPLGIFD